jgi:hypothetical protein
LVYFYQFWYVLQRKKSGNTECQLFAQPVRFIGANLLKVFLFVQQLLGLGLAHPSVCLYAGWQAGLLASKMIAARLRNSSYGTTWISNQAN